MATWNGRTLTAIYPASEHHDIFNIPFPSIILLDTEVLLSHVYKLDIEKFWLWTYLLKVSHACSINPSTDTPSFSAMWVGKHQCLSLFIPELNQQRNMKSEQVIPYTKHSSEKSTWKHLKCIWTALYTIHVNIETLLN